MKKLVAVIGVAALVLVGCSKDKGGVGATESDYKIVLDDSSAPAGSITFNIKNDATQTHEFVVFKTDLPQDQLPTNSDGDVDEEGTGVTHIDEVEDIAGGTEKDLTVNLEAGNYVVICNLPGHYRQGMHAAFTVS